MAELKRVEVCFSPSQFHLYKQQFDICVVIDVLRATSAICTALDNGVKEVIPCLTVEEAADYQSQGYIGAAERNGEIVEGFEFGNSPRVWLNNAYAGSSLALTTTNGTKAINIAAGMDTVVIGSINNLDVLCDWLVEKHQNVLILASGWKDKFNLEDTICGGAIADALLNSFSYMAEEDSTIASKFIYLSAKENIFSFLKASSHRRRLRRLKLNEDVKYCLTPNIVDCIPIMKDGKIIKLETD